MLLCIRNVDVKVTQSCSALCDPTDYSLQNSPGQDTGVGSLSLLQGIFPAQGWNPGLPHCRQILYQLSHKKPIIISYISTHLTWMLYSIGCEVTKMQHRVVFFVVCLFLTLVLHHLHHTYVYDSQIQISACSWAPVLCLQSTCPTSK